MAEDIKLFDWDDEILEDGAQQNFVTLEEGDYPFTVEKFERGHYTPSANAKTPACNQANITLKVTTAEGACFIVERFPLASTMEWKISAFFRSIGLKQHGEKLKMSWNDAIGRSGKAHITKTAGTKEGTFFNNVGYFIDPVAKGEVEWN